MTASLLRNTYCHPEYAYSMLGYGVDVNAPEPPFVLFKVLHRNMALGNILDPIYVAARTILRLCAGLVGYLAGLVMEAEETVKGPDPVSRDQRIPRPSWGPDLSLLDDEYL